MTQSSVTELYRRRAKRYDITANLYYLAGFREQAHRVRAVRALGLRPGATVVEIGCGTGLNFPILQEAIGPSGRLVGVDLTDAMLDQARRRVRAAGWSNVELVQSDAGDYEFPAGVDGILSTFALEMAPGRGDVVERGARALAPGGRWAVLGMKVPPTPLALLMPLVYPLVRPFGVTPEVAAKRPWETIWGAMFRSLEDVRIDETFGGTTYLASGTRRADEAPRA